MHPTNNRTPCGNSVTGVPLISPEYQLLAIGNTGISSPLASSSRSDDDESTGNVQADVGTACLTSFDVTNWKLSDLLGYTPFGAYCIECDKKISSAPTPAFIHLKTNHMDEFGTYTSQDEFNSQFQALRAYATTLTREDVIVGTANRIVCNVCETDLAANARTNWTRHKQSMDRCKQAVALPQMYFSTICGRFVSPAAMNAAFPSRYGPEPNERDCPDDNGPCHVDLELALVTKADCEALIKDWVKYGESASIWCKYFHKYCLVPANLEVNIRKWNELWREKVDAPTEPHLKDLLRLFEHWFKKFLPAHMEQISRDIGSRLTNFSVVQYGGDGSTTRNSFSPRIHSGKLLYELQNLLKFLWRFESTFCTN